MTDPTDRIAWQHVSCPLCGADAPRRLVTDHVWRSGDRLAFPVVRCTACRLVYVTPRAPDGLFYTEPGGGARRDAAVANRPIYEHGLAAMRAAGLPGGGRILDVGCANGDFLAFAADRGYEVVGVDINPSLAAVARERGFEVHGDDLRSLELTSEFDAVTLWDVIEHVGQPVPLLAACGDAIRPSGLVFFHTGNARFQIPKARLLTTLRPNGGPYLVPHQHLTHFDPASARTALRAADLSPVDVFFAGTLHYRQGWKRAAMGTLNAVAGLPARLGGPLLTSAMGALGRRPPAGP